MGIHSFMRLSTFLREAPFIMLSLYITAKVAGKPVSISEASIRSDLLFDDADGIDSLPNQAIFDAIQLMGIVTPLFASMLVQPIEDEGATSERPSEPQPTPSPPHPSEAIVEPQSDPSPRPSPTTHIPDFIPEDSGRDHGDDPIWEVIQNGNGPVSITTDTQEDHLVKFHKMTNAKEMWEAIKSRFGVNDESKKMQKYILKQQFEGFSVSNSEGLHKGYDRLQSLLSQLEIHGAGVSTEDANQKFLRSLPSAWSQVSLIVRTKPGVDSLSFDDLYNNLRVFESDVKSSTASSSSTQNVAFVSENTSSTNDVSTAYGVSNSSSHNSQYEQTSSYSLLANQSSFPQLDHEDLEQLDEFDLEEMDLKWQEPVGFDKTKVELYNCHKTGHFARECRTKGNQDSRRRDAWNSENKDKGNERRSGKQEDSKALVTIDGEGVDWTSHSEEEEDYALMACNISGLDIEVQSCSNECVASYNKLKKLYDKKRAQLSDASIEIKAYTQALKKVEAQLVAHQQGQLCQMSANDKFRLGYGDHRYDGILIYENEFLQSVFMNKESDLENQPLYDRFVTAEGMHAVPPPMTGNYMPSRPDIEIDYSHF
ncbi:ribonuclease H-like domain-containing protein [Tanacetum coccineum]